MNKSSSCPTGISKHSKIMDKNTRASRSCIHHYFLVFGYPGETVALVVLIYYMKMNAFLFSVRDGFLLPRVHKSGMFK